MNSRAFAVVLFVGRIFNPSLHDLAFTDGLKIRPTWSRMLPQKSWPMMFGLIGLLISGCSEEVPEGRLPVYPASGKVTVGGQPAAGVLVVLRPGKGTPTEKEGAFPSATTNEDGAFQLTTYEQNDGAPAGDYAVTIRWNQIPSQGEGRPANPFARPVDRFRGKYNNPQTSPWRVTITKENNVLNPIAVN